ncbi:MAG TPA: methyltransferase [Acidimicrobiales bacterium]
MVPPRLELAVYGLVAAPVLHLADEHGILAALLAEGPLTARAAAERTGTDHDTVERMLLVLTAFGIVERADGGEFAVPGEMAPFLDGAGPDHIGGFVQHMVDESAGRLAALEDLLRRGSDAVDADRPAPYDRFYRDEASTGAFLQAMWDLSYGVSQELAELAALDGHRHLVDVGGANGPFAVAALEWAPGLTAVVFDLPEVAPHLEETRRRHGLADRLAFQAGDFFVDDLPEGDLIALGYVLSNWPDAERLALLRKAHAACAPGGRVLVMERLFDDGRRGPISTAVMNLEMQVETRGRHRTGAEYRAMLAEAGFAGTEVRRSSRDKHLVIGTKPGQGCRCRSAAPTPRSGSGW